MSKTNDFETALLELILNNVALASIGDAGGLPKSVTDGNLYIALCKSDPGEAGDLVTAEIALAEYAQYLRVAVGRDPGAKKWTVTAGQGENANAITFAKMTSGTGVTATHFAVCKAGARGVDDAIYHAALTGSLAISANITPTFAPGALTISEG